MQLYGWQRQWASSLENGQNNDSKKAAKTRHDPPRKKMPMM
jgi:hypothetical protein